MPARSHWSALCGLLLFLLAPALDASAAPTACPGMFVGGQAPDLRNPKLAARTTALCFLAFAVEHSGVTRTPLWSAEHLTAERVEAARLLGREGSFHAEPALPPGDGAELADLARSGYDRGHMAPSGDFDTRPSQAESFSLANMIPQAPRLNRGLWEGIESAVRRLAVRDGAVYVVTGPIFQGDRLSVLRGRVVVPTLVFKAVYDPVQRQAAAYLTRNTDNSGYAVISIAQLTQLSGIDPFPALPDAVKERASALPRPTPHGGRRRGRSPPPLPLNALVPVLLEGAPQ